MEGGKWLDCVANLAEKAISGQNSCKKKNTGGEKKYGQDQTAKKEVKYYGQP